MSRSQWHASVKKLKAQLWDRSPGTKWQLLWAVFKITPNFVAQKYYWENTGLTETWCQPRPDIGKKENADNARRLQLCTTWTIPRDMINRVQVCTGSSKLPNVRSPDCFKTDRSCSAISLFRLSVCSVHFGEGQEIREKKKNTTSR